MTGAASLDDVWKRFGAVTALSGVSFEIGSGEIVALLGPNGAGKTTAFDVLLGLRQPDRGRAALFGAEPRRPHARRRVGVTPQETAFPPTLTVGELLSFVAAHHDRPASKDALLERFELAGLRDRRTGGLSGGEKRRLGVALAFAGGPDLVVLDEPTTGLDVASRRAFREAIREYHAEGGTAVLTTHYLEEAEAVAERVVVLNRGVVAASGSVAAVVGSLGITRVRLQASDLPVLPGVVRAVRRRSSWVLDCRDADALVRELVRRDVPFRSLEVRPISLEEAFVSLTRDR